MRLILLENTVEHASIHGSLTGVKAVALFPSPSDQLAPGVIYMYKNNSSVPPNSFKVVGT